MEQNGSEFLFDDIKTRSTDADQALAFSYGPGNQLTQRVRVDGVIIDVEYDAWGRAKTIEFDILGSGGYSI